MFLLRCCVATKKDEGEREFPLLSPAENSEKPGKPVKGDGRRADDRPERADYGLLGQKRPSYGADCSSCPSNLVVHIPCDPEEEQEQCPTTPMLPAADENGDTGTENDDDERCREDGCLLDSTCSSTARLLDDRPAPLDYLGDINQTISANNYTNISQSDELTPGPSPPDQETDDTKYLSPECVIFEMDGNLPAPPVYLFRNEDPPNESTIVNLLSYSQCFTSSDGSPLEQVTVSEANTTDGKVLSVFGFDDLCNNTVEGETFNHEKPSLDVFPGIHQDQPTASEAYVFQPVSDPDLAGVVHVEEPANGELLPVNEHLVSYVKEEDDVLIDSVSGSFVTELLRDVMNTLRDMPQEVAVESFDQFEKLRPNNHVAGSPDLQSNEFVIKVEESVNTLSNERRNDSENNAHAEVDDICNGVESDQNFVKLDEGGIIHTQVLADSSDMNPANLAYVVDCQISNPCNINNNENDQFSIPCSDNNNTDEHFNIPCSDNNIDYKQINNPCQNSHESDHKIEPLHEASKTLEEIGHEIATDAIKAAFQDLNDAGSTDSEASSKCDNESKTIERKQCSSAVIDEQEMKENSISKSISSQSSLTENSPDQCSPVEKSVVVNMSDSLIDRLFPDSYDEPETVSEVPKTDEVNLSSCQSNTECFTDVDAIVPFHNKGNIALLHSNDTACNFKHKLINTTIPTEHQLIHTVSTTEYQLMDTAVNIEHEVMDTAVPIEDQLIDAALTTEHHLIDTAFLTSEHPLTDTAVSITEHQLIDTVLPIEAQLIHTVQTTGHQLIASPLTTAEHQLINTAFTTSEHQLIDTVHTTEHQLIDTALTVDHQVLDTALCFANQLIDVAVISESQGIDSDHTTTTNTSSDQKKSVVTFSEDQLMHTEITNVPEWIDTEVTIALPLLSHDFIGEKLYKLCLSTAFPDPPSMIDTNISSEDLFMNTDVNIGNSIGATNASIVHTLKDHKTDPYQSVSNLERISSSEDNEQVESDNSLIEAANNIVRSVFDNVDVKNAQQLAIETTNEQQWQGTEMCIEQQLHDSDSPNEHQLQNTGILNEQQLQDSKSPSDQRSENLETTITDPTLGYEKYVTDVIPCDTWASAPDWRETDSGSFDIPPPPPLTEYYHYTDTESEFNDILPPPQIDGGHSTETMYAMLTNSITNKSLPDLNTAELPTELKEANTNDIENIPDSDKNLDLFLSGTECVSDNLLRQPEYSTDIAHSVADLISVVTTMHTAFNHDSDSISNAISDPLLRNEDVISQTIKSNDVKEESREDVDDRSPAWQHLSNQKTWWNWGGTDACDNEDNNDDVFSTTTTNYCPYTPVRPASERRAKSDIERFFSAYVLDLTKTGSPDDVQSANVRARRELDIQPLAGGIVEKVIFNVGHYDDDEEDDDEYLQTSVTGGDREFSRPVRSVRRSASLKTSPETTPHKKKVVRFADALGLDLTSIRTIRTSDDNLPSVNTPGLMSSPAGLLSTGHGVATANHRHYFCPGFAQPISFPDFPTQVRRKLVLLESCAVDDSHTALHGVVRVWNVSFRKDVTIRHTVDGWTTSSDTTATYIPSPSLGGLADRFAFRFTLALPSCYQGGCRVEFAIRYRTGDNLELEYWDNNDGANYPLECYTNSDDANQANWMCFL